jgi:sulfate adenylyltransferase subunit 1 (EFTu-like GTPase family)
MELKKYLKVVLAGDVDAGKSTLIGRFLYESGSLSDGAMEEIERVCQGLSSEFEFAYLLDSFEEERQGQLTIDTTQSFCRGKRGKQLIFIDVPGHQELLKNMICGSSYAEIAILVVDANKSIQAQTKRHLFVLEFLGVDQIIVAVNKMDAVDYKEDVFEAITKEINAFSAIVGIKPGYFIPLSAKNGENMFKRSKKMPWYEGLPLAERLDSSFKKRAIQDFRFSIQDVYELNNKKVAVGEIISGKIKPGQTVNILPLNKTARVKKINVFNKKKSKAVARESIGLTLDDMSGLCRGQIICKSSLPKVTQEVLTRIICVRPLDIKEKMIFKCATQEAAVCLKQITGARDIATLEPRSTGTATGQNDVIEALLITDTPIVVEKNKGFNGLGRFVLKVNSEICAVGIIL